MAEAPYTAVPAGRLRAHRLGLQPARLNTVELWPRIPGMNHLAALLTLIASSWWSPFHVPRNHIRATLKHLMTLGVKTWAFAHLIANNTWPTLVLFGSFLLWSIVVFRAARRRNEPAPPAGTAAAPRSPWWPVPPPGRWPLWLWLGYRPLG